VAALAALHIRPLRREDQQDLWHWLHIALWDPPPAPLRPRELLDAPNVRIYAEGWGKAGDIGVVGELGGRAIGACWLRLLPASVGLASVDEHTPQLGIAVVPEFQGRGFGGELMAAALRAAKEHGYRQVSLTVHPQNPAIALYERHGFEKRELRNTYHLMVAALG
jgi:ribosomal protein S18 acetylase RimI-like enzyme